MQVVRGIAHTTSFGATISMRLHWLEYQSMHALGQEFNVSQRVQRISTDGGSVASGR